MGSYTFLVFSLWSGPQGSGSGGRGGGRSLSRKETASFGSVCRDLDDSEEPLLWHALKPSVKFRRKGPGERYTDICREPASRRHLPGRR